MLTRKLTSIALLCLLCCATRARADVESPEVLAGVAAYNGLEYEKAITVLRQALNSTLTREEKMVAYKTLAFSYFATGNRAQAIVYFVNVLRIDENFELDRSTRRPSARRSKRPKPRSPPAPAERRAAITRCRRSTRRSRRRGPSKARRCACKSTIRAVSPSA